jgi:hypothetical protein
MRRIVYWQTTPDRKQLLETEQRWLDMIPKGELGKRFYNLQRHTSKWIANEGKRKTAGEKIGAANRVRVVSEETRKKLSTWGRSKTLSPEHREKIGAAHRDKIRGPQSPERRAANSFAHRGLTYKPRRATECPYCHRLIRRPTYHGDRCRQRPLAA